MASDKQRCGGRQQRGFWHGRAEMGVVFRDQLCHGELLLLLAFPQLLFQCRDVLDHLILGRAQ